MRLSSFFTVAGIFLSAGGLSLLTASFAARMIEAASETGVLNELDDAGLTWAEVDTNGLQVFLIGTAPDEVARFQALTAAGRVVDASRVIDQMLVEEAEGIAPPRFSIEILRNDAGISVIGLVPEGTDRAELIEGFRALAGEEAVTDLLESAAFPAPDGWDDALRYAAAALRDLPRSKVSVEAGRVAIKAMTESAEDRARLETVLSRRKPDDMRLALDISAPRPVITPFTLRFLIDENGARFDACSADTEQTRDRILRAAARAGLEGKASCKLGLGVPSRRWADAVELAIGKLAEIGAGTVTFSNADVTLVAHQDTPQALFDRVVGELEAALPEVFALHAVLPKPADPAAEGPPDFTATLSPEGQVQLRGRLSSEIARQTADSFARARFGSATVYTAARVAENLPSDWSIRTLAALEALSLLANGAVTVTPDNVEIAGQTGNTEAGAQIAALFAQKLGETATFDINVSYVERLDPTLGIPTPEECEQRIIETVGARKISFEPGSARLDVSAKEILDELADLLKTCGDIPLEIGGHTDSQGRETMNQELSQERAEAVLSALRARRVPVKSYTVRGYGEENPIADNATEEGREANRRIEFRLIKPEPDPVAAGADADGTTPETVDGVVATTGRDADAAPAETSGDAAQADAAQADAAEADADGTETTEDTPPPSNPEATRAAAAIGADRAVPEEAVRSPDFVPDTDDDG